MFDKVFFVLAPSYQGATLLAKLINAHPEVTTLGGTYTFNAFDQLCRCRERTSACHFWQAVKSDTGAERYEGSARALLPRYPGEHKGLFRRVTYSDFSPFCAIPRVLRWLHCSDRVSRFRSDYEAFLASVHRQRQSLVMSSLAGGGCITDGMPYRRRFAYRWCHSHDA